MTNQLQKEIYIIPTSFRQGSIIYAPLKKCAFWVNDEYTALSRAFLEQGKSIPEQYIELKERLNLLLARPSVLVVPHEFRVRDRIVFILSQCCNLDCTYCYAHDAHSKEILSWDRICMAINQIMDKDRERKKEISFIGGGEPMATWELLQNTVQYAENLANTNGLKISFSMTTNGTLLTSQRADWLKKHNFRVAVSFEILPDVQNTQRHFENGKGSFAQVDKGIHALLEQGIIPNFRATITELNVKRMEEMVQFTYDHYPMIKNLHFEHVSDNTFNQVQYYDDYIKFFFLALNLSKMYGINLKNSIMHSMKYIRSTFCGGEFCVTPTGDIVSCHRASSVRDELFGMFWYGHLSDGKQELQKPRKVRQNNQLLLKQCASCFARWHCAGGCAYNRLIYSQEQMDQLCNFTKNIILQCLERKIIGNKK